MSTVAVKWAKRQVIEDRTMREMLGMLARSADNAGVCSITQPEIAKDLALAEKTIRRTLPLMEDVGLITRSGFRYGNRRGRVPDAITLNMGRDFTISKEEIMGAKRLRNTGQNVRNKTCDLPDKMSGMRKSEIASRLYKERARGVVSQALPSQSALTGIITTRVRFDDRRGKWRASITAGGVTMELGSFISEDEAIEFAEQSRSDVIRTSTAKAGTPSHPVARPDLAGLQGAALVDFLIGDSPSQELDPTERSSQAPKTGSTSPDTNGVGVAGALVPRTKSLAGVGGAHEEPTEQDAARARASGRPALRVVGGRHA